jgi:hypothetical protein
VSNNDELRIDWEEIGCFRDLATGQVASSWFNPFTAATLPLPRSFSQGAATYTFKRAPEGATVQLEESLARVTKSGVTAQLTKGRLVLTLSETKIRSFPKLDGGRQPPDIALLDVTQDRTVISLIGAADAASMPTGSAAAAGLYSTVYDDLPSWLGFGDRLGGCLARGIMRRAALTERVNAATWRALQQLHPRYFSRGQLRFSP